MNAFKKQLAFGEMAFAINVGGRNADTITSLARHGAHAAFIDCERSGIALDGAAELLFAARAAGLPSIVRTHSSDQAELVRFLDRGADGLIIPHCDSAEEAAAAVEVLSYACGSEAASRTLVVQIETKAAVADLERIARVPGIDAILIGPNDLAWDVCGVRGAKNPEMTALLDSICARLAACGARYGMPAPPGEFDQFRRRGCNFVYYSMDWLIASGMQRLMAGIGRPTQAP